jgi:DNA-binding transcriptional LysR family regulator
MLELRLLRYFVAVAETEHVGRAAVRLHISQSPLSRQIRQLETQLGLELFQRIGRRLELSEAGRRLLAPARDLLARADAFEREASDAGRAPPRLSVGFVVTALTTGVLSAALRRLRARHPELQIDLRNANSESQLALLRAGELDVALVQALPAARELRSQLVLEQPYQLAVPRSAPFARRALTPALLGAQSWIAIATSEPARERWLAACAAAGFVPHVVIEVADYASALALVDAGMGVALVPASERARAPAHVVFRALDWFHTSARLWVVTRVHASPQVEELARQLAKSAR